MHARPNRHRRSTSPSWLIATVVISLLAAAGCTSDDDGAGPTPPSSPPTTTLPVLSGPSVVSYAESASWLDGMSAEDQIEQIRDWAVIGLASLLELDVTAARDDLYDTTSMRDALFAGIDQGPTGPGRSLPDGRGTLHLLVPADDPFADRTIGTMMDDHRKDAGTDEVRVQVHRYSIDQQRQVVELTSEVPERSDVARTRHGYVEAELSSGADIAAFLSKAHHLSRVELRGGDLWASGWGWGADVPSGVVTAEDIAELQHSYRDLNLLPGFSLDPAPEETLEQLTAVLPGVDPALLQRLWNERSRPADENEELAYIHSVSCEELLPVAAEDRAAGSDDIIVENVMSILGCLLYEPLDADQPPSLGLPADRAQLWALNKWLRGRPSFSVARYDGGLVGTEVGMTLFYTDMVAKNWVTGVGVGVPSKAVPGFVPDPETDIPWGHCDDTGDESGRLWFGQDDAEFSVGARSLDIGSVATRLFVHSDGTEGEVEPSYGFGRGLRWWDRHFVAIADYEPQYHRLDQLMRWSAAIEWAILAGWPGASIPVSDATPGLRFDQWYGAHQELRERDAVAFVTPPGITTEALLAKPSSPYEMCRQLHVKGGVSLGDLISRSAGVKLADDLPTRIRRGGTFSADSAYNAADSSGILRRIAIGADGTVSDSVTWRLAPPADDVATVAVERQVVRDAGVGDAKLVNDAAAVTHVDATIVSDRGLVARGFTVNGVEVGRLTATKVEHTVRLRWHEGPVSRNRRALSFLDRAVRSGQSLDDAVTAVPGWSMRSKDPLGRWLVRVDGERWAMLDDDPAVPPTEPTPQIGVPGEDGKVIQYRLHDAAAPTFLVDGQPAQWYRVIDGQTPSAMVEGAPPPAPSDRVIVAHGRDGRAGSYVESAGGAEAAIDDPLFGPSGPAGGAAMLRHHLEMQAAETAAATDDYLRGMVWGDDGAALVGSGDRTPVAAGDDWTDRIIEATAGTAGDLPKFRVVDGQLLLVDTGPLRKTTGPVTRPIGEAISDSPNVYLHPSLIKTVQMQDGTLRPGILDRKLRVTVRVEEDADAVAASPLPDIRTLDGTEFRLVNATATRTNTVTVVEPTDECETTTAAESCPPATGG
jgi:hypothetical protein